MAYSTISYGSSGKDVKTLQEYLNNNGYSLDVDGQFGSKTQAAVKDYQKKKGLSVDGVVGTNTWGSLSGTSKNNTNTAPKANAATYKPTPTPTRPTYTASSELTAAEKALKEWESKKPGAYVSEHSANIDAMLDKVLNGEKFSYNAKEDPLFQQYKDMYVENGKLAMNDTIAQAAALTGGYNSSYGTAAAQQIYQQYLTELNNKLPEFYDRKYQIYLAEKEGDLEKLALLQQMDDAEYAKYRDEISDYNNQLGYLYQKKADLSDEEWQKYQVALGNYENDRDFNESVRQYNEQMAYQKERDKVSDEQWEKTYALQAAAKSSSGGGSSRSSSGGSSNSKSSSTVKAQDEEATKITPKNSDQTTLFTRYFPPNVANKSIIEDGIEKWYEDGRIGDAEVAWLWEFYGI